MGMAKRSLGDNPYKTVWPKADKVQTIQIEDRVSKEKNNKTIDLVYKDKELLGFARVINTTTGCNSACLPIKYKIFYDNKGNYKELIGDGLTKINHTPLTEEDLAKLNLFIISPPSLLIGMENPLELTDALSGATLKKYEGSVIKGGAYSTLRIVTYHLKTQEHIKEILGKLNVKENN